jgi:signal transduction histidine kinase
MARPGKTRRLPVELRPLLESSLSFLKEKLARRGIEVRQSLKRTPSVIGDAERLQQLFLNLLLNAADAMRDGGELRIWLERAGDAEIEVGVADSGVGIPEAALEHVFEPFYTTKPAGEGNGLGLMVAKGIVTDHGGSIDVSSEAGKGTTFLVRFPLPLPEAGAGI